MKLKDALFCITCEEIFELKDCSTRRVCPSCTGSLIINVSKWIKSLSDFVDSIPKDDDNVFTENDPTEKCKDCSSCPSYHVGWKDGEKVICCTYYRDCKITGDVFEVSKNFECPKAKKKNKEGVK